MTLESESLVELLRLRAEQRGAEVLYHFLSEGEVDGPIEEMTYRELELRARAVGALLQSERGAGERALLLYPPGLDYIAAFFGCLCAEVIAVPAYPPDPSRLERTLPRLQAIVRDCGARLVLTTSAIREMAEDLLPGTEVFNLRWLATDTLEPAWADAWKPPHSPGGVAFLQYTSGSTGDPKGVIVSHRNLLENSAASARLAELGPESVGVSWLPCYHDMGLIGGIIQPLYSGFPVHLFSPLAFLQKPLRWLRAISRYRASSSPCPNFALELCCRKATSEDIAGLDLRCWRAAFNGAEPIRWQSLERFSRVFGPAGFSPHAHRPVYGLAESTLIVSGGKAGEPSRVLRLDAAALSRGEILPAKDDQGHPLVGCGQHIDGHEIAIVDPTTRIRLGDAKIGELWLRGPSVAQGYWNRPRETEEIFGARLAGGEGPFLRTGDLGFLKDGELYLTGRLKDLIILRGRNYYPQDIEHTVEGCHPSLRPGCGAAFSVAGDDGERLAVVHEVRPQDSGDWSAVHEAIVSAVSSHHEVRPWAVVLLSPGAVPKTSSGKIQRSACRTAWLQGKLEVIAEWREPEGEGDGEDAGAAPLAAGSAPEVVEEWLVQRVSRALRCAPDQIDVTRPLLELGLDSSRALALTAQLEQQLGVSLPATLLWDHRTLRALAARVAALHALPAPAGPSAVLAAPVERAAPTERGLDEPIAVVGMACRFPRGADLASFARALDEGVDAVSEVPKDRWDADALYDADPDAVGKLVTRQGAFLTAVDTFDAHFFDFAPREAEALDPQHRLLLEVSWEALESAGLAPDSLGGSRTGVYVGIASVDYLLQHLTSPGEGLGTGVAPGMAAGRIAHFLDLRGPAVAVDTQCSASLVGIHLACQSLRTRECDVALAGGAAVLLNPQMTIALSRMRVLAPDGRCKAFDAGADGYGCGEGCGVVVLMRLSDALAGGYHVHALIRGSALNHDGRCSSITVPSGPSQEALLREALGRARVSAADIGYLEAHGTGTPLGDTVEGRAIAAVLGQGRPKDRPLAIGSVKTNIGHLLGAAGVAGFIKAVLAVESGHIPPSLHFKTPNPHVPLAAIPAVVPTRRMPWPLPGPRFAGVSAFGLAGTNAHAVISEAGSVPAEPTARSLHLLTLSAKTSSALDAATARLAEHLRAHPDVPLADIAYTLQVGRSALPCRRALVCREHGDALAALEGREPGRLLSGLAPEGDRPVAFMLSGVGDHYPGMGAELYRSEPVFRQAVDTCCEALEPQLEIDLRDLLYPPETQAAPGAAAPLGGPAVDLRRMLERPPPSPAEQRLRRTLYAQPAVFVVDYAMAKLWMSFGVQPRALIGHSIGELVAAHLAGVFELEDALRLVAGRARLIDALPVGAMLAIQLDEAALRPLLDEAGVDLCAVNGPRLCVAGGESVAVARLEELLRGRDVSFRQVAAGHAFHSRMMAPVVEPLRQLVASITRRTPRIPIASNTTGLWIRDEQAVSPDYWAHHIREPVRFGDGLRSLCGGIDPVLLEVGPGLALTGFALQAARKQESARAVIPSIRNAFDRQSDAAFFLGSLGRLWLAGAGQRRGAPYASERRRRVALPTYPFERARYRLEAAVLAAPAKRDGPAATTGQGHHARPDLPTPYAAPQSDRERELAAIWQEVLGLEQVGIHDNFFDLGGSSLFGVQILGRLRSRLAVDVPMQRLFEAPTVAQLAAALDELAPRGEDSLGHVTAAEPEATSPLAPVQERLWYLAQAAPDSPEYNMAAALRVTGPFDPGALDRAIAALLERHDVLRAAFVEQDGRLVMASTPPPQWRCEAVDLIDREGGALRWQAPAQELSLRPFDLSRPPLLRAGVFRLAEREHVVVLVVHHIVYDMLSGPVLFGEVIELYRRQLEQERSPLPALPAQYADFVRWHRQRLDGRQDQLWAFWRQQLHGELEPLALPADRPRPDALSGRGASALLPLPVALLEQLSGLARERGTTLFATLLTGLTLLLHRHTGQDDVVVGIPATLRSRPELEGLVGAVFETLALRVPLEGDPTFAELLERVHPRLIGAFDHREMPLDRLARELAGRRVFFQVYFGTYDIPPPRVVAGATFEPVDFDRGAAVGELNFFVQRHPGKAYAAVEYSTDLFAPDRIARMLEHYRSILEHVAADPALRLSELPLLSQQERRQILEEWNDTAQPLEAACAHHLFEAQVERTPDAVALVAGQEHLTYRELDVRANQLAHHLRALGVREGSLVGIFLERSIDMVVGLFGVLKAGAAYVPLEPELPQARLAVMLEDARPGAVLTRSGLAGALPGGDFPRLCLDTESPRIGERSRQAPPAAVDPDSPVYVMYTSGSTGRPKGVVVCHRGVVNLVSSTQREVGLTPEDRVLQKIPFGFDISVWGFFWPLAVGARLVLAPPRADGDPAALAELIQAEQVTSAMFVPSMLGAFVAEPATSSCRSLRHVFVAGETLPHSLQQDFGARFGATLHNAYGPTETSIYSTTWTCRPDDGRSFVPIGRPIANTRAYILDGHGQPVPVGVPGEIYLGGAGLAQGYLNQPALTAERFVPDPFSRSPGARLYRTGDMGRYQADGVIEFLGRNDGQVKLRGFRIELGELEETLRRHPGVAAAAAVLYHPRSGAAQLDAYVVLTGQAAASGPELSSEVLPAFVAAALPAYMQPRRIHVLESLPATASGKVDRRALRARSEEEPGPRARPEAPRSEDERTLATLWSDLLLADEVGVRDDFFDLGGDSILATHMVARARALGLHLTPAALRAHPTIAGLVESGSVARGPVRATPARQGASVPHSLFTPMQRFFWELRLPNVHRYNFEVHLELKQRVDPELLRRSLQALVARHEPLRWRYRRGETGWEQWVAPDEPAELLRVLELSSEEPAQQARALAAAAEALHSSLSLETGPLVRAQLFDLGPARPARLLLVQHHMSTDTFSLPILLEELETLYQAMQRGAPPLLPPLTTSAGDWVARLAEHARSPEAQGEIDFWLHQARPADRALPLDFPEPSAPVTEATSRSHMEILSAAETRLWLTEAASAAGCPSRDFLVAALAWTLARWTGGRAVWLALAGHGREPLSADVDLSRSMGWLAALYPLHLDLGRAPVPAPRRRLSIVHEQLRRIPRNGLGYGLLRYLSPEGSPGGQLAGQPYPEVTFDYLGQMDAFERSSSLFAMAHDEGGPAIGGATRDPRSPRSERLAVNGLVHGGRLCLDWNYSTALHHPDTIRAQARAFMDELRALLAGALDRTEIA